MKITHLDVKNYLGVRTIDVRLRTPVTLFGGGNYAGKSSLAEAIRHALAEEFVRVEHKKDFAELVNEGGESGYVLVEGLLGDDAWKRSIALPGGQRDGSAVGLLGSAFLPFVLNANHFASLSSDGRRGALFALMGLSADGQAVKGRLTDRGCDAAKIEAVMPLLRAGFDAAHKEAQAKARDSKAAWRAITGETYGSQKAMTWTAQGGSWSDKELRHAEAALKETEGAMDENARKLGGLDAQAREINERAAKLSNLKQRAAQFARIQAKLIKDEKELVEWEKTVAETQAKASGTPAQKWYACPECSACLILDEETGSLIHYTPPSDTPDAEALEKLPTYTQARDLLKRSVENDRRDLESADSAAKALKEFDGLPIDPEPIAAEIAAVKARIETLKKARAEASERVKAQTAARSAAQSAEEKTAKAKSHHGDVQAWEKIGDALAPSGIPAELLRDALGPINARISDSAEYTQWLPISIDEDMNILSGARDYRLLSESERWRADAMIAEAISHLSGLKLLALDRFDVLSLQGRVDLIEWLDAWSGSGDIDTALIFGTLKTLPTGLPDSFSAFWLSDGQIQDLKAAA